VKAVLPANVSLTGKIFPSEQADKLTFDLQSREIVWNVGDLLANQEASLSDTSLYFQISFLAQEGSRGKSPELIGPATISGEDQWTGETIQVSDLAISTALPDDPSISGEQGKVK
jgi:hypothetical protein